MNSKKILSALGALLLVAAYLFFGGGQQQTAAASAATSNATVTEQAAPLPEKQPDDTTSASAVQNVDSTPQNDVLLAEDGIYTSKEDVALYLYTYGKLPGNFITKKEAEALGWPGGDLEPYAPGKCIGGSHFGNYEGQLPEKDGRTYHECDIDTLGAKSRGAKRIIYSNDGLIYYTGDHYGTFEQLYGEETQ